MKPSTNQSSRNKRPATHAPIRLTVLAGAFDKVPAHQDDYRAWSDVADEIEALALQAERPRKTDLPAISFAKLSQPYNVDEHVECLTAIAIDVDRCNLAALRAAIKRRKLAALVYASPSDDASDPDARRVRVCAPVTRPIAPDEIKHVRRAFAEAIGIGPGCGVETAEAASQIMFAGRVEGTPARETWRHEGAPVDVDALLAAPLKHEWKRKATPAKRAAASVDVPADAGDPLVPLLWAEYDAGGRREIVRALAGWFAKSGQPESRLLSIVAALPSDQVPARLALARETYAQAREGAVTAGWDALVSRVGAEHAPALETALAGLTWGPWWEAFTARRKSRLADRIAAARAANDTTPWARPVDLDAPGGDGAPYFAVTRKGGSPSYFVRDCRGDDPEPTFIECGSHSVHATLRETYADHYVPTHVDGKRLSVQALTDRYARTIEAVEWDFSRNGAIVYDAASNKMLCGVTCPQIAPVYDAGVATWLRAIAGSDARLAALHEWIASTRQAAIHRLATALLIVGPHGVGKSLFGIVCARQWGALAPVDLAHVVKQFNASMTSCPIVADDECRTLARKVISTEDFRSLVQQRVRAFEPKNKEMRMLHGAQRFVLSTNDLNAFTFANVLGSGAVDAIAERLLQIVISEADAPRVRLALDALRLPDQEIDFARLDGHWSWICETTELPDGRVRFLGSDPDKEAARASVVASTIDANEDLFERVRAALHGEAVPGLTLAAGAVWVRPSELALALVSVDGPRWDAGRVRRAIAPFRGPRKCFKVEGKTVHAVELDALRLVEALAIDPEIALAALEGAPAPRGSKFKGIRATG